MLRGILLSIILLFATQLSADIIQDSFEEREAYALQIYEAEMQSIAMERMLFNLEKKA